MEGLGAVGGAAWGGPSVSENAAIERLRTSLALAVASVRVREAGLDGVGVGRDERDVDARASTRRSRVLEGELEERATVRAATAATGLEVAGGTL